MARFGARNRIQRPASTASKPRLAQPKRGGPVRVVSRLCPRFSRVVPPRAATGSRYRSAHAEAAAGPRTSCVVSGAGDISVRATDMAPLANGNFFYTVRFRLSEITGKSGATITYVETSTENSRSITGPACWRSAIRVAPGETLDLFDTGGVPQSYCAPEVDSRATVVPKPRYRPSRNGLSRRLRDGCRSLRSAFASI